MKVFELKDMKDGWFIGDFEPSVLKTPNFEVNYRVHKKGEFWRPHTHTIVTEYNLLVSGRMSICGRDLVGGQIFILEPGEVAAPEFHEDCAVVCVKTPSASDKVYV